MAGAASDADATGLSSRLEAPTPNRRVTSRLDLVAAVSGALAGAGAFLLLPGGSWARVLLVAPIVLLVPGYLALQAVVVATPSGRPRPLHVLFSLGLSPAVVGLAALLTAIVPGGFREGSIVAAVTFACLALAWIAWQRRRTSEPEPAVQDIGSDRGPAPVAQPRP